MNYRKDRIEHLLNELKYEVTRGIMEGDLDPYVDFVFDFPRGNKHIVGRFFTKEVENFELDRLNITPEPIVKVIK